MDIAKSAIKNQENAVIVVSAFSGVTDQLIKIGSLAAKGNNVYKQTLQEIRAKHLEAARSLIDPAEQSRVLARIQMVMNDMESVLHGVFLVKEISARTQDLIMSFGERLSAYIISEALNTSGTLAEFLDTRAIIKTDDAFGNAKVQTQKSFEQIQTYFSRHPALQIATGFIASTDDATTTTLGRGGSDYTAALLGAALGATVIEIWTDVDGVMTADPQKVKGAFPLAEMSYEEAMEMSHFGAKVIYPPTVQPAMEKHIPLLIKNSFNPQAPGTLINNRSGHGNGNLIKGITSIKNIALLSVEGSGMVGVSGTSKRVFSALAQNNINIILITQASSEHSICIAVEPKQADSAKQAIDEEFALEIETRRVNPVTIETGLSIVAVVGEQMRNTPGIAGRLFRVLGRNGINVRAIAQGSSELNISMVISQQDETKALNAIHDAFFLSDTTTINLFLAGTGLIGSTLIKQINEHHAFLKENHSIDIRLVGVVNQSRVLINTNGISTANWRQELEAKANSLPIDEFTEKMKSLNLSNSVFADCTASEKVVAAYENALQSNISVVTPNKKACSGSLDYYQKLKRVVNKRGIWFFYETNVGAGLPVINTLNELLSSGDKILKIEAVLSGTLSYIFNTFFSTEKKFSDIVREAKEKGYTEPNPRDDLSGLDVARKILILARETGLPLELNDVKIEPLISKPCQNALSVKEFFEELEKNNGEFEKKREDAKKQNNKLHYIASLENGQVRIDLRTIDRDHPFYSLSGSDNIISLTTERYRETPLVVKGPGAGAEVTAAGVLADIIRIGHYMTYSL